MKYLRLIKDAFPLAILGTLAAVGFYFFMYMAAVVLIMIFGT